MMTAYDVTNVVAAEAVVVVVAAVVVAVAVAAVVLDSKVAPKSGFSQPAHHCWAPPSAPRAADKLSTGFSSRRRLFTCRIVE
jgi:hypothetical protein